MNEVPKYRRKHYFIKKDYQTKFILKFCLLVLAGLIISTIILLLFSYGTVTTYFEHGRLIVKKTAVAIMPAVFLTNSITLIIIIVATILVVLFVSHKIAGPMFRFEREIHRIGQGDLTVQIFLRKDDQIKKMADNLNAMTGTLQSKLIDIRSMVENLLNMAEKKSESDVIEREIRRLHEFILNHFKM